MEHVFYRNPVAARRIVDKHVGDGADDPAVLYDRLPLMPCTIPPVCAMSSLSVTLTIMLRPTASLPVYTRVTSTLYSLTSEPETFERIVAGPS
jgi:hypothetical protein